MSTLKTTVQVVTLTGAGIATSALLILGLLLDLAEQLSDRPRHP